MNRTRVKICGITRPEDGLAAALAGADAIGLVFYPPSPRNVDISTANRIIELLPPFITRVGLFVDAADSDIRSVLGNVDLDMLQFHGDETDADCRRYGKPWLKAIRMLPGIDLAAAVAACPGCAGVLLDSSVTGRAGGTGQVFDWGLVNPNLVKPVVLAGGLHAGNVRAAIEKVGPYAVDVSSGVESAPGIKDAARIAHFIEQVGAAR